MGSTTVRLGLVVCLLVSFIGSFRASCFKPLWDVRIVLRLGDPDFQAKIIRVLPIGFAGVGYAVAIAVFEIIWNAVAVVVKG